MLSVVLGAFLYSLVQFLWYSPFLFGRTWLSLKRKTPTQAQASLTSPTWLPESFVQLVAPAFLMSASVHALFLVLLPLGQLVFLVGVIGMGALTTLPKYGRFRRVESSQRRLWLIGDGALWASLSVLVLWVWR